ncbi:hypothetical protein CAEBREN_15492 [Caenorhabditis brenneri]|uniref:BTB domain-containing protein n=1 Tax=Caenorhabditis brenneri TaxID=135651 RepID=G0NEK4_CAEBE|nr:hypothetical protein CAEBREN_15492 [Caenorhabditis brenneri]
MKKFIEYDSGVKTVQMHERNIDTGSQDDLAWGVVGRYVQQDKVVRSVVLTWVFDLNGIKRKGFDGVGGCLEAYLYSGGGHTRIPMDIDLTKNMHKIRANFDVEANPRVLTFRFTLKLAPYKNPPEEDPTFQKSDETDCALKVEGILMHVNKSYLSMHSEYFKALFSANFSESGKEVIVIEEVKYKDICMLLKVIYPRPVFPNDSNVAKLLELADRFLMCSAIDHIERHLLTTSDLENDKILGLADKYNLPKVIDKCIRRITSRYMVNQIRDSPEYSEYSLTTKGRILDRIFSNMEWCPPDVRRVDPYRPGVYIPMSQGKRTRFSNESRQASPE